MLSHQVETMGPLKKMLTQLYVLKQRFKEPPAKDEMAKWLMICTKPNLYEGIPDILHFSLCCFTKALLEAPAETMVALLTIMGVSRGAV